VVHARPFPLKAQSRSVDYLAQADAPTARTSLSETGLTVGVETLPNASTARRNRSWATLHHRRPPGQEHKPSLTVRFAVVWHDREAKGPEQCDVISSCPFTRGEIELSIGKIRTRRGSNVRLGYQLADVAVSGTPTVARINGAAMALDIDNLR
jgi:hypothetical protein